MDNKKMIWLGVFIGSTVGGFVPALWGESAISMTGIVTSAIGAFVGIWLAWKMSQ